MASVTPSDERTALAAMDPWARTALGASVGTAFILVIARLVVWLDSGSVALLSTLLDGAVDLLASIGAFGAAIYAAKPKDFEHRFGHDKAEAITSVFQAVAMIMTTVLVSLEALRVFLTPQTMRSEGPVLGVALFAIALTAALVILQTVAAKRSGSLIVKADRAHYLGDFALNLAVVLSALGAARGYTIADPLLALVAAGWIAYQARGVLVRAVDQLMDRELDDETRQAILEAAQGVAGADRVRALRTRMAGSRPYVSFHLEMDPDLTLLTSHHIALEAEERVKQVLPPGAEVLIHPDPLGWTEDHPDAMILDVMEQDAREP